MIIIFSGSIGRFPVGGHAWINMQYLAGLRALGHDVFYLEDCGEESWVYNWETRKVTCDLSYPTAYIRDCLDPIGFSGKWIYRAGKRSEGMALEEFLNICSQADLLIVRAVPLASWRIEYGSPKRRIFIDADPGFTHLSLIGGDAQIAATVAHCERLFTIGQRIGASDCPIPTADRKWIKTVSPVWLPAWPKAENDAALYFTTIMQWKSYGESHSYRKVSHKGVYYGQKDSEFSKLLHLPRHTAQRFRIALTGGSPEQMSEHKWEVVSGWEATRTPSSYQSFIYGSRAEFSVAKHGYVTMRAGWFSDRSVCYLAAGKPVLVEDTGLGDWLPIGEGVLTFHDMQEALRGIEEINLDYGRHCQVARRLAEEFFSTDKVLPPLLEAAMN